MSWEFPGMWDASDVFEHTPTKAEFRAGVVAEGPRYFYPSGDPAPTLLVYPDGTEEVIDWGAEKQGCDCTELCSMGPTCPGGMLARLPGSGCWRTEEATDQRDKEKP